MRKIVLIALVLPALLLFSLPTLAQKNFIKGYFVTTANDTIQCFINDRAWNQNPKKIEYKITLAGETDTFRPAEIKSFGLSSGDIYEGRIVTMDQSSREPEQLKIGPAPVSITDTVFLRVLVRGAANLLHLNAGNRDYFYYQAGADNPVELVVHYYLEKNLLSGKTLRITSNTYQAQLKTYFAQCPAVTEKITTAQYTISDMRAAFKTYNSCLKNESYEGKSNQLSAVFGVVAGTSFTKVKFETEELPSLMNTPFRSGPDVNVGLSLNLLIPQGHHRWSIYNELLWKGFNATGTYHERIPFTYQDRHYYTEFKVKSLGLGSMLRYHFLDVPVRPFVSVGLAANYILKVDEYQNAHTTFDFSDREEYAEGTPLGAYKKLELAATFGAGLAYKKFTLEGRAEMGNSFAHTIVSSTRRTSGLILLGYSFQ